MRNVKNVKSVKGCGKICLVQMPFGFHSPLGIKCGWCKSCLRFEVKANVWSELGNKWANALVPPTPFQGWRKKCADIEPLKKPSKRLGLNIVKHTYVYIYSTLHAFHSQKWNDDRTWGILMT